MNIGNHGYSSWIQNTSRTGYGYGQSAAQTGKVGAGKTFFGGNEINDTDVINSPAAGKAEEKTEEKEKNDEKNTEDMTLREQILAHMEEMAKKVKEGRVEPSFQIGGQTFTIKEWDKLLADFDDAAEGLQEQIKELIAEVEVTDPEELADLLTGQVAKCSYPTDDPKNKHWFITCFGQDGIMCREAYMENGKWVNRSCWNLPYTEPGQREKVLAFIQRFPQDANLRFASHEVFWKDFLAGEIDEDDFVHFFETSTKDGVPDYTYEKDGSTYIDREKAKYAKYMNDFGAHFYTAEEMELIQRAVINENRKGLKKLSDYDGQMTIPGSGEAGKSGKGKNAEKEEDDLETQIITKPDGSTVLQIETSFGVMEVEITEAQKFGLQYNARPGAGAENPFARSIKGGADALAAAKK